MDKLIQQEESEGSNGHGDNEDIEAELSDDGMIVHSLWEKK